MAKLLKLELLKKFKEKPTEPQGTIYSTRLLQKTDVE